MKEAPSTSQTMPEPPSRSTSRPSASAMRMRPAEAIGKSFIGSLRRAGMGREAKTLSTGRAWPGSVSGIMGLAASPAGMGWTDGRARSGAGRRARGSRAITSMAAAKAALA